MRRGGYILLEALVSLSLLSIGMLYIHRALQQAIVVRAQTQDYTQARFLLEDMVGYLQLQPQFIEKTDSGGYDEEELRRFKWAWEISKIDLPMPELPPDLPEEVRANLVLNVKYLTKIKATISWTRTHRGKKFKYEESIETLSKPGKLWIPPEFDALQPR